MDEKWHLPYWETKDIGAIKASATAASIRLYTPRVFTLEKSGILVLNSEGAYQRDDFNEPSQCLTSSHT